MPYILHCLDCAGMPTFYTTVEKFIAHKRDEGHRRMAVYEEHETLNLTDDPTQSLAVPSNTPG